MRPAIMCLLILAAPMVSGITLPLPATDSEVEDLGEEVELVLSNGYWTQDLWINVQDMGLEPLRVVDERTLLVWKTSPVKEYDWFEVQRVDNGEWRGEGAYAENSHTRVKILLEPRLPKIAQLQVINNLRQLGIAVQYEVNDFQSPISSNFNVNLSDGFDLSEILSLDGILWVEPVLKTEARNLVSAGLMGSGSFESPLHWSFGLNGNGVILGVADSGLDADHSCFRNATSLGAIGSEDEGHDAVVPASESHRKVVWYNMSLDDGDNPGDSDYRHGTHIAGTLVCHDVYSYREGVEPTNGSTMSYGAKLLFQDIVSSEGWVEPENITELLLENTLFGAVIHSNSWGDDTTAYTARSADFDLWAREVPWSLSFIAPGNSGGQLLEPANARNVVAIGSSTKAVQTQVWQSSSIGPTDAETYGIFAVAPGVKISSAKADGLDNSLNNDLYSSTGTSMSTPMAASFAGVLQQMVEQGWLMGDNEPLTEVNLSMIRPNWSDLPNSTLQLGSGFTPSGSLLKSLMGIATSDIVTEEGNFLRNNQSGWGVLNLSQLLDFEYLAGRLSEERITPSENIWLHDSFRNQFNVSDWLESRLVTAPDNNILQAPWNGEGAVGPFLQTGEVWTKRLVPSEGQDLEVILSFPTKPEPFVVDDLQMVIELSDGRIVVGNVYDSDGFSSMFNRRSLDFNTLPKSNETSLGAKITSLDLQDIEWFDISVRARFISPGNSPGTVGVDGDRVGFAIAAKGVVRDSTDWGDSDGDGIANSVDMCPNQNPLGYDVDVDGCSDDSDYDGIIDQYDVCPETNSNGFDINLDGCIDDVDGDGVLDNIDRCKTFIVDVAFPVNETGCRPIDEPLEISAVKISGINEKIWQGDLIVSWRIIDLDDDEYMTGAKVMLNRTVGGSYLPILFCENNDITYNHQIHTCSWRSPDDLPILELSGREMHVQIFAQSLNNSPEGDNTVKYFDSAIYFTTNGNENLDSFNNTDVTVSNTLRSVFWGILTVFGVALLIKKLRVSTDESNDLANKSRKFKNAAFIEQENE